MAIIPYIAKTVNLFLHSSLAVSVWTVLFLSDFLHLIRHYMGDATREKLIEYERIDVANKAENLGKHWRKDGNAML